ncbi:MAG: DsbA family protein [Paracoccaceae bacterium]|nr:DsbA family protein [Paracoccaceae bacterium]
MRRRDALVIGGIFAIAIAIPPILRHRSDDMVFSELPGMPGFRRLERGDITPAFDSFAGLQTPEETAASARLPQSLCPLVFPTPPTPGRVPIAVFSDYYCPFCAILDQRLADLETEGALIDVRFHELPLLGERSRWAARVALAAAQQGDHTAIHLDMMQRVLRPGFAGIRDVAERHNLDAAQMMETAKAEQMGHQIEDALALGRALGVPGTPALMVGRTLVVGALPERFLSRLIALESKNQVHHCSV